MADNPYMTVASPSYGAPLVNLFGNAQSGMDMGQAARRGVNNLQNMFKPQNPGLTPQAQAVANPAQGGSPMGQQAPWMVGLPQQGGPQPGQQPGMPQNQPPQYARNLGQIFGLNYGGASGASPSPGAQSPTQWQGFPTARTNFDYSPGS